MLSVRRQVREEMQHDLKVIASVDVVSSYESCVKSRGSVETDVVRIDANLLKYDEIEVKGNSLLRASTFDLLCNLVTQEALVRVLRVSEKVRSGSRAALSTTALTLSTSSPLRLALLVTEQLGLALPQGLLPG